MFTKFGSILSLKYSVLYYTNVSFLYNTFQKIMNKFNSAWMRALNCQVLTSSPDEILQKFDFQSSISSSTDHLQEIGHHSAIIEYLNLPVTQFQKIPVARSGERSPRVLLRKRWIRNFLPMRWWLFCEKSRGLSSRSKKKAVSQISVVWRSFMILPLNEPNRFLI